MVLIELLAYAGDQLSYQQDAVANEAYLDSARQRVSVRRHARLRRLLDRRGRERPSVRRRDRLRAVHAARVRPAADPAQPAVRGLGSATGRGARTGLARARGSGRARMRQRCSRPWSMPHLHQRLNAISIYTWDLARLLLASRDHDRRPRGRVELASGQRQQYRPVGIPSRQPARARGDRRRRDRPARRRRPDAPPSRPRHRRGARRGPAAPRPRDHPRLVARRGRTDLPPVHQPPRCRRRASDDRPSPRQRARRRPRPVAFAVVADAAGVGRPAATSSSSGRPEPRPAGDALRAAGGTAEHVASARRRGSGRDERGCRDTQRVAASRHRGRRRDRLHGRPRSDRHARVRSAVRGRGDQRRTCQCSLRRRHPRPRTGRRFVRRRVLPGGRRTDRQRRRRVAAPHPGPLSDDHPAAARLATGDPDQRAAQPAAGDRRT